jgi:hypothetical protein
MNASYLTDYLDHMLEPVDIRHLLSRLWRERLG